jgi:hypothetical protein
MIILLRNNLFHAYNFPLTTSIFPLQAELDREQKALNAPIVNVDAHDYKLKAGEKIKINIGVKKEKKVINNSGGGVLLPPPKGM